MNQETITYRYVFNFDDDSAKTFDIELDTQTLAVVNQEPTVYPEWTALNYCKCPNCPLDEKVHPRCPVAVNLVDVVNFFNESISYEEVRVEIDTEERSFAKDTTVQKGVSSLLGILMVTSGCPVLDKLRPMVRFHLRFATPRETTYRAVAMYLMAQYFINRRGMEPDWELQDLVRLYGEVQKVNHSFGNRLRGISAEDANPNALIILDCFANYIVLSIDEDMLLDFEVLFKAYLEPEGGKETES